MWNIFPNTCYPIKKKKKRMRQWIRLDLECVLGYWTLFEIQHGGRLNVRMWNHGSKTQFTHLVIEFHFLTLIIVSIFFSLTNNRNMSRHQYIYSFFLKEKEIIIDLYLFLQYFKQTSSLLISHSLSKEYKKNAVMLFIV